MRHIVGKRAPLDADRRDQTRLRMCRKVHTPMADPYHRDGCTFAAAEGHHLIARPQGLDRNFAIDGLDHGALCVADHQHCPAAAIVGKGEGARIVDMGDGEDRDVT